MSKCGICVKSITVKQLKLLCNDCQQDFHGSCLGMSKADIDCIVADSLVWRCNPCATSRRKSLRFDSEVLEGKLTLEDIMRALNEIKEAQRRSEREFNTSYEGLNNKLDENIKALHDQSVKVDEYLKTIENLTRDNSELKKKNSELEGRLEELEDYTRINSVEIYGVPEEKNEDVVSVIKEVGKGLDVIVTDDMIDACHRLGKKPGTPGPRGIIVKFVRRLDKEKLMQKRRVKRNFSTRHMNLPVDQPVYINDSLSPARRKLYALARTVKRDKHFKYLWVRNGKIFMRKEENCPVKRVRSQADLDDL